MEQSKKETRLMGIDYGEKRIGIALCDPLLTFAYPFTTIKNDSTLFTSLSKIVLEKNISKILIGLPSIKFRSSKALAEKVFKLKSDIETKIKIEVILWDEEYSSIIAKERMIESVAKKSSRKKKELIDQHSAAVILQEYLDSK